MLSRRRLGALLLALCLAAAAGAQGAAAAAASAGSGSGEGEVTRLGPFAFQKQEHYHYELVFLAFVAIFIVNIYFGRARNERLAIGWTSQMVKEGGVLDRNFALLGPGDTRAGEVLLKESMHEFKLWASGRRYCQSFLATFILKRRQDMIAQVLEFLSRGTDVLDIEIAMNESAMPPVVLAIAPPSIARSMAKNFEDLENYTKRMEVEKGRLPGWPPKGLAVYCEHSSVFYDLMTPHLMDLLFGPGAWPEGQKLFRSLHVTSEYPRAEGRSGHKQVIRLSFTLPPAGDTEALQRILTLATVLIDIVGTYKLTPDQTKRAQEARARVAKKEAGDKEAEEEQRKRAEERRQKKAAEEKERLRKMTPEQRARYEEKKRMKQFKSQFRVKAA